MTVTYNGNFMIIRYDIGDKSQIVQLPDGYSFDTIAVLGADNINVIYDEITFTKGFPMRFPPVNSKSPCILRPLILDNTKKAYIRILIMKFGQIPDINYFNKAFKPILVTGEDGNEYNVIPSDQFK